MVGAQPLTWRSCRSDHSDQAHQREAAHEVPRIVRVAPSCRGVSRPLRIGAGRRATHGPRDTPVETRVRRTSVGGAISANDRRDATRRGPATALERRVGTDRGMIARETVAPAMMVHGHGLDPDHLEVRADTPDLRVGIVHFAEPMRHRAPDVSPTAAPTFPATIVGSPPAPLVGPVLTGHTPTVRPGAVKNGAVKIGAVKIGAVKIGAVKIGGRNRRVDSVGLRHPKMVETIVPPQPRRPGEKCVTNEATREVGRRFVPREAATTIAEVHLAEVATTRDDRRPGPTEGRELHGSGTVKNDPVPIGRARRTVIETPGMVERRTDETNVAHEIRGTRATHEIRASPGANGATDLDVRIDPNRVVRRAHRSRRVRTATTRPQRIRLVKNVRGASVWRCHPLPARRHRVRFARGSHWDGRASSLRRLRPSFPTKESSIPTPRCASAIDRPSFPRPSPPRSARPLERNVVLG